MAKAKVTVTATDNLAKGLNQSKKQLNDFEKYVGSVGSKISKAFSIAALATATVAGFKAMGEAAKECIREYSEAEKVSKRLEAVWKNVGTATGISSKQMDAYAESIEKVTYFSSESVKQAGLLLAATESLNEDGFQRALEVSVDLAAALGEDVTSAAQTLAKAIQEPEAALSRLKTIGVSFTEDEKAQIKALSEANQKYEAQALILDKIEAKYQGVAKAINATPVGTLDNIKDTLGDIRENLGGALLDVISPALEEIYGWLLKISEWTGKNRTNNKVITAAQNGTGLYMFSKEELQTALDEVWKRIGSLTGAEAELFAATGKSPWDDALTAITSMLKVIEDNERWAARPNPTMPPASTATPFRIPDHLARSDFRLNGYNSDFGLFNNKMDYTDSMSILGKDSILSMGKKDLSSVLEKYGKLSSDYQMKLLDDEIANVTELLASTDGELNTYLNQILGSLLEQRNASENGGSESDIDAVIMKRIGPILASAEQADSFKGSVTNSLYNNMGKAGEVAGKLATNMATMGPLLGAIATALEYVLKGVNEVAGPMMDMITDSVIQPLVEVGKSLGRLIIPVLNDLAPVLQFLGSVVVGVVAVFEWIGQLLRHWAASFVNAFTWITGYSMYDPGGPGNIADFVGNRISEYKGSLSMDSTSGSVGTETAVSSASYRGATSVTINIYPSGPIVGEGGMREFARMIRDEFDALDYYGVTA